MNRKLFISFAPLLATVMFAVMPTGVQAAEHHWYSEGAPLPEGVAIPTETWGDLSLNGAAQITCHTDTAGEDENPVGGKAGIGIIEDFAAYECESNFSCPAGAFPGVEPENQPWSTELIEVGGKVRQNVTGVKLIIGCVIPPEETVTGTAFVIGPGQKLQPLAPAGAKKGTSALHPGFFEYDSESGEMEAEGSGGKVALVIEGITKTLGYEAQEHIYTQ